MKSFIRFSVRLSVILTGSVLALSPEVAHAFGRAKTKYQITLGDSISAGFIGFSQVSAANEVSINAYEEPEPPLVWKGIRYISLLETKRKWAWPSGTEIDSVASRLDRYLNAHRSGGPRISLQIYNQAESSAQVQHLPRQARLAAEKIGSGGLNNVSLITVMIGANDACRRVENLDEDVVQIRDQLLLTLSRLQPSDPAVRTPVFVSAVPNIPDLSQPDVLNHPAYLGLTCGKVREKLVNFCPDLLNWSTPSEYQARVERVQFINRILETTVELARTQFPGLDLQFDTTFNRTHLSPDLLAWDCFHPGRDGQAFLAKTLWEAMPWFK